MTMLIDKELLLRLRNTEDNFVERKTSADSKDWLKTVVAFANSTPVGYPAVLFIGVTDNGTPESKTVNLDSLQKSFGEKIAKAYPPIYYTSKILTVNGREILGVIVPGSELRPHFAGPSFVRRGPETVEASEEQFADLIAKRSSKVNEILKWKGKDITVTFVGSQRLVGTVVDCNQFYCTIQSPNSRFSLALSKVHISFDNPSNRLELEVHSP